MKEEVISRLGFNVSFHSPARLLSTLPESRKEERATSILLAVMKLVPDFAHDILGRSGTKLTSRSKLHAFTEVCFKSSSSKSRPDGLVVVESGNKKWSALVESKVGNNELDATQLEEYLLIARDNGIDAILTFSNEYTPQPDHHPTKVSRQRVRNVPMYHFSWLSLQASAFVLLDSKRVTDPEQAFILDEFSCYLSSEKTGITTKYRLSSSWRAVSDVIYNQQSIYKSDVEAVGAVTDWHQLVRYMSIQMSNKLGKVVLVQSGRRELSNPPLRLAADVQALLKHKVLVGVLKIPDAASDVTIQADFMRRSLSVSMSLSAPKDVKRPTASINWIKRQLTRCETGLEDILFVRWPRRYKDTSDFVQYLDERGDALVPEGCKDIPLEFTVRRSLDVGGKFKSASVLVDLLEGLVTGFYGDIGQNLSGWVPKAPRLKVRLEGDVTDLPLDDVQ